MRRIYKMSKLRVGVLIFAHVLYAMEKEIKIPITKPTHVLFLDNKNIAIAGLNGFCFFDVQTKKTTHLQQDQKIEDFCTNKSKTKIATSSRGVIRFFDVRTRVQEWKYKTTLEKFVPITFNSQKEDVVFAQVYPEYLKSLHNGEVKQNYITSKTPELALSTTSIACHPHKESVIYTPHDRYNKISLYLYHTEDPQVENSVDQNMALVGSSFWAYEFTHDGKYIILNNANTLLLLRMEDGRSVYFVANNNYSATAHSQNNIFATLSDESVLQYWDFEKFEKNFEDLLLDFLPKIAEVFFDKKESKLSINNNRLSFSPDGKLICIALQDTCFTHSVVLDTEFQKGTMEKLVPIFWCLQAKDEKNKKEQNYFLLFPTDIINIIKSILLNLYRIKK
jgi:hypothetical protein